MGPGNQTPAPQNVNCNGPHEVFKCSSVQVFEVYTAVKMYRGHKGLLGCNLPLYLVVYRRKPSRSEASCDLS
jgi:hypothetical protein